MLACYELLGFMSADLAGEILNSAYELDKSTYRTTLAAVANARKVRPVFLERQPRAQRHVTMIATLARPAMEMAANNLLRGWLMSKHKTVLVDFLNTLGIAHNEGMVENLPETVDDAQLKAAVESLLAGHPHEVVAVYLHAFNTMNETRWTNLEDMLRNDPRLQLGG